MTALPDSPPGARPPDMRPRLLLHVGLAKTASTSLQHNVLMPWHDAQRINFLGRHWEEGRFHYPFAEIFERIAWRRPGRVAGVFPGRLAARDGPGVRARRQAAAPGHPADV